MDAFPGAEIMQVRQIAAPEVLVEALPPPEDED